ncbi:hypothetical protein BKA70DRAFT_1140021 [Coprinopsis sp. MPI-PUGE-AT-0042]|nr:hypothetical protein BKA70DRAFT_1140021 [Coprinopsis sp. MPI-PUGE-AT-0042]
MAAAAAISVFHLHPPVLVPHCHLLYAFMSSATTPAQTASNGTSTNPPMTVETAVELAKRAFALKKYEQAIEHYSTALEIATEKSGEDAPELADLYFSYGRALLENAIASSSVLGKDQPEDAPEEDAKGSSSKNGPILSFSGDVEDGDDPVLDLSTQLADDGEDEDEDEEGGDDDADEPEDDFNAAWQVLEIAKKSYEAQVESEDDDEIRLKLADTFIALGDVSLETEKFDQAVEDYESGLKLKLQLLPISSRHIAEAHYKLSMVLDLTPGRLSEAIQHVEGAVESVEHRLAELRSGLQGQFPPAPQQDDKVDPKGKGKQVARKLVRDDLVQNMSKTQMESEIKDLEELKGDLALKIEELKTLPADGQTNAVEMAAKALDKELNATGSSGAPAPVNDLTSIVKKKKKPVPEEGNAAGKRKAESEVEDSSAEKKVRLEEGAPAS